MAAALVLSALMLAGATPAAAETALAGVAVEVQQKWSMSDLKSTVQAGIEQGSEALKGIKDSAESAKEYAKALKDEAFRKAVDATGVCEHLSGAEEDSAPEIGDSLPDPMAEAKDDPGEDELECEAIADEVTADELGKNLKAGAVGEIVDKLLQIITQQTSAALCAGKSGIRDWMKENSSLRTSDPAKYKEELKKRLNGKVGPILDKYTAGFCPDDQRFRLFEATGPVAEAATAAAAVVGGHPGWAAVPGALAAAAVGAALLALRLARRAELAALGEPGPFAPLAEDGLEA